MRAFWPLAVIPLFVSLAIAAGDGTIVVTADTEGHVAACGSCPADRSQGGLPRRAALVQRLRGEGPVLLLDAGNWIAGPDTVSTRGELMVSAYNLIAYDAVHLTPADLYWGKDVTLATLKDAKFAAVSCNLLDSGTGKPLVSPYVVKTIGSTKVAILGVAEPPAAMESLPQVQERMKGITIRPTAEALDEWLPKAAAESDRVIVLYQGSGRALRTTRKKVQDAKAILAVSGLRPDNLPDDAGIVATAEHGKSVANLTIGDKPVIEQVMVGPNLPPDPATLKLIADRTGTRAPLPQLATAAPAKGTEPPIERAPPATPPAPTQQIAAPPTAATKAALPRIAAKQPHVPKGLAGVGLTDEQINATIDRGCAALWQLVQTQAKANDGQLGRSWEGYHTVAALALAKAGFHKHNPEFDRRLREYLVKGQPETLGTYAAGTLCMLVEAYGDPRFEPVQRRAARYLLEGQGPRGWEYTPRVPEASMLDERTRRALQVWGGRRPTGSGEAEQWKRATTQPAADAEGDNSLAQYAVMGLQSAVRAGVAVPPESWQKVLEMYRSRQTADGGWSYLNAVHGAYGSMTCAGGYAISVARHNLGEKDPGVDEQVEQGLAWLAAKFTVSGNPNGPYHYYYLYSLERLCRTLDTEFVGPHEWYPLGARYLVDAQKPDGTWMEGDPDGHPELTTAFALLFLKRGTPPLQATPPKLEGPGTLRTALLQPPAPRVYFILDCSGSMLAEMGGKTKFDLARQAITQLLAELPDETVVALRAYGHRKSALDAGASEDTELVLPLAPLNRQTFADRLKRLRARGKTPLARSLRETINDIAREKLDVILLTDGGEDTQPRQDPVEAAELFAGLKGVAVHIVGFDIGSDDWGKQLRGMASAAQGRYWPAQDADALLGELRAAVLRTPGAFEIIDAKGVVTVRGTFGDTKPLPAGQYTFVTRFGGQEFRELFWINRAMPTAVLFDAGRFDVSAPQSSPAPGKTCSNCGRKLEPGQKFCPGCGRKTDR